MGGHEETQVTRMRIYRYPSLQQEVGKGMNNKKHACARTKKWKPIIMIRVKYPLSKSVAKRKPISSCPPLVEWSAPLM